MKKGVELRQWFLLSAVIGEWKRCLSFQSLQYSNVQDKLINLCISMSKTLTSVIGNPENFSGAAHTGIPLNGASIIDSNRLLTRVSDGIFESLDLAFLTTKGPIPLLGIRVLCFC